MKLARHLSALLLVFAVAAAIRAQTAGHIRGTVVDDAGKALAGVIVEANAPSSGRRSTTTGKDGQFRFSMIPPGDYKVHFRLESYSEVEKNVVVRLDATATVNAKLFHL